MKEVPSMLFLAISFFLFSVYFFAVFARKYFTQKKTKDFAKKSKACLSDLCDLRTTTHINH
jgi:hypothetical protein